jgi:hypothetical protein
MLIIADIALGPAAAVFGFGVVFVLLLILALIEAPVLWYRGWATWWRCVRDSLIMNTASTIVGFILSILMQDMLNECGYDPARGGRWCEPLVPTWLVWLGMFLLTIVIEFGVLRLLRKEGDNALLLKVVALANALTYALLLALWFISG